MKCRETYGEKKTNNGTEGKEKDSQMKNVTGFTESQHIAVGQCVRDRVYLMNYMNNLSILISHFVVFVLFQFIIRPCIW